MAIDEEVKCIAVAVLRISQAFNLDHIEIGDRYSASEPIHVKLSKSTMTIKQNGQQVFEGDLEWIEDLATRVDEGQCPRCETNRLDEGDYICHECRGM